MFDSLKKYFKKDKPEFNELKNFAEKNKYFYRIAPWDWLTEKQIHALQTYQHVMAIHTNERSTWWFGIQPAEKCLEQQQSRIDHASRKTHGRFQSAGLVQEIW